MIQSYAINFNEDFVVFDFVWLWYCVQLEAVDAVHQSRPLFHLECMSFHHLNVTVNPSLRAICI